MVKSYKYMPTQGGAYLSFIKRENWKARFLIIYVSNATTERKIKIKGI